MVAGDAVNTAARVQSAAEAGTVLVDDATQRLASASVGFADAGEHVLKGKAQPARLWQATRVLSGVGGSQRVDGLEAPFLGRDAELRTVKELLHASAERRSPRLVLASGPAGVGKSRLGLGVPQVRRRAGRVDVLASGPVPVLRRGRRLLGVGRDRPATLRHRRRGRGGGRRRQAARSVFRSSSPTRPSRSTSARGWRDCSASAIREAHGRGARPGGAVRGVAAVLRAPRRCQPRDPPGRGRPAR